MDYLFHYETINDKHRFTNETAKYNVSNTGSISGKPFFELFLLIRLKKRGKVLPLVARFFKQKSTTWKVVLYVNPGGSTVWHYDLIQSFHKPLLKYDRSVIGTTGIGYPNENIIDFAALKDEERGNYFLALKNIFAVVNKLLKIKRDVLVYQYFKVVTNLGLLEDKHFKFDKF